MLHPGVPNYFGFTFDNWGANPSVTPGTSVVPGASSVEGTFTQVASGANIAEDCYFISLSVIGGATSATSKLHLLDIGVDNAGGSSYTAVISNIACGGSGPGATSQRTFSLPFFIKAGSSVAVRIQGNAATAGTVRVMIKFFGRPSNPLMVPVGRFSETIGTVTGSSGPVFTPGNAADGAWLSLGTTTNAMWFWQLGIQIDDATMTANAATYVELAFGDATNKLTILRRMICSTSGEEIADVLGIGDYAYCPVPAGSTLYVRGRCNATPDSNYNALAVGIGG